MTPFPLALLAAVPLQEGAPSHQAIPSSAAPATTDPAKLPLKARALTQASATALVAGHPRHARGDPLEGINRRFFRLNAGLDKAIFRPAALGYKHVVPRFARSGLRNFFSNLTEPIVFLNDLLQLKPGRAAKTLVRFAVNSTIGLAGLADPAKLKPLRIVHHDNGFGSTLGRYGVGPGPYVYLPFAGPTTLRDLLGGQADRLVLPFTVQQPPFNRYEYQVPKAVITGLDARAEADDELKALFSGAVDPYATLRSVFLQNRAGEIAALRGRPRIDAPVPGDTLDPAAPELKDPLADPAQPAPHGDASPPPKASAAPELSDPLADPAAPAPAAPARR
ncbi:MlaA family lipoprotein [Sphingomonas bacterium]|uniref:MlaA family lipoprotein n=1 Tax=Sphingomonas bacterium TaxID=1895847 RepID=UPI001575F083|nr:VacJ family lipoprotein [Sphingomonas bacterium]